MSEVRSSFSQPVVPKLSPQGAGHGNALTNPVQEFESLWRAERPPDVRAFLERNALLTPQQIGEILCVDQWQRWQKGDRISAETYLQMAPTLAEAPEVAFDLVYGEFLLLEQLGENPTLEQFLTRFPQFADRLQRQSKLHEAIETDSQAGMLSPPAISASAEAAGLGRESMTPASIASISQISGEPQVTGQSEPAESAKIHPDGKPGSSAEWPRVPGYTILAKLGQGGMGEVFKAKQERLDRLVALKIIRQECLSQDPHAIRRFRQEAQAAAKLSHPNIVTVYDFDQVADTYFLSMEYVDGVDLHQLVRDCGPLPVPLCCHFIHQAALGLNHAYQHGMVHRDIKPSNLLVAMPSIDVGMSGFKTLPIRIHRQLVEPGDSAAGSALSSKKNLDYLREGVLKILDMGMALLAHRPGDPNSPRWTQHGTFMGTPDFIAPEQAMDAHEVDIRADLYSLGCTFYFLLTGRTPFGDYSLMKKLMMHQIAKPQPIRELQPEVPAEIERIVNRLLAKLPEGRYQTPLELAETLVSFSLRVVSPGKAPPQTTPSEPPEVVRQKWTGREEAAGGPKPAKVVAVLKGFSSGVMAVSFSPDRETLACGAVQGSVRLWDLGGAKPCEKAVLSTQSAEVHSLAFDPNNRLLAIGSGSLNGLIWLWDLGGLSPKKKLTLPGHQSPVETLAFSHDGRWLASGGCDKTIRLWELTGAEPKELAVFKGHTGNAKALAFSPDCKTLASASLDGGVGFWRRGSIWSKDLLALLREDWGPVHTISYSPNGKLLAFAGLDQTVRLFDVAPDQYRERATLKGHIGVVRQVQFDLDGQTLVSVCDGGRVISWKMPSGEAGLEWQLPKTKICSVAFTIDARYLATGTSDGLVKIFRVYERTEG
jgi:serine/threonine-protein kinase